MQPARCHDFVTDALWVLYRNGVALKAEEAPVASRAERFEAGSESTGDQ